MTSRAFSAPCARARRLAFLIDGDAYFTAVRSALMQAHMSVQILSWDIDGRTLLPAAAGAPTATLAATLRAALAARPDLQIYILNWHCKFLFAAGREPAPRDDGDWRCHPRVHYRLDRQHPWTACHHQKLVLVDGQVAFVGGMDLYRGRWDSRAHAPDDGRRRLAPGTPVHPPIHDVQAVAEGEVARPLAALFAARWRAAGGPPLPARLEGGGAASAAGPSPWPAGLAADLHDVALDVLTTAPAWGGAPAVREVEGALLAAIAAARHSLYIETPYLTARAPLAALCRRLAEIQGPEVIWVGPRRSETLPERLSVDPLRSFALRQLRRADRHGRLRALVPVHEGPPATDINLHTKLLIADDERLLLGSANLNNRSMGLDTECVFGLRAAAQGATGPATRAAIRQLRFDLLGEHLGCLPGAVAAAAGTPPMLCRAIAQLGGGTKQLVPMRADLHRPLWPLRRAFQLADPQR